MHSRSPKAKYLVILQPDFKRYIFICSYGRRYDITQGKIPSSAGVKTIIDYLIFQHDEVFNYFIDKSQIHQVIVTDDDTAQRLFHT